MKNKLGSPKSPSLAKQKTVSLVIVSVLALVGLVAFLLKATDRRAELRQALEHQDDTRLEKLLTDNPNLVHAKIRNRSADDTWEPLHMAACYGSNEAVQILLKHKAKINARDANGLTPLHYTVSFSRYNTAQLLINKGADMNAKGKDGRSPLELAKTTRDKRMIALFRVRGAKE